MLKSNNEETVRLRVSPQWNWMTANSVRVDMSWICMVLPGRFLSLPTNLGLKQRVAYSADFERALH